MPGHLQPNTYPTSSGNINSMYKSIYLKKGKEESLKRFHPWIFSGAIQTIEGKDDIEEGETVRVLTSGGEFIAVGHYQIGSIAIRILSFDDVEIDESFWENRILSALQVRISIGIADNLQNDTYRLIHGAAAPAAMINAANSLL